jgi:uncharacterized protein YijF (DUF1287 family)
MCLAFTNAMSRAIKGAKPQVAKGCIYDAAITETNYAIAEVRSRQGPWVRAAIPLPLDV